MAMGAVVAPLGSLVEAALAVGVGSCEQRSRLVRVRALEQQISVLRAEQTGVLAGYRRAAALPTTPSRQGWHNAAEVVDAAAEELAVVMTWTTYRADTALEEATVLHRCLPGTLAALESGTIDYPRAQTVVRAVGDLDDEQARAVDTAICERLGGLTTAQAKDTCEREVLAVDAAAAARRHARRTRERGMTLRGDGDAIAVLKVIGPAAALLCGYDQLTAAARALRAQPGQNRTLDQVRFDLLITQMTQTTQTGQTGQTAAGAGGAGGLGEATGAAVGPPRPGPPARVRVTVAATTLAGLDEHPGELAGYGPIPAAVARDLAAHPDSRHQRVLVDPHTGMLLATDQPSTGSAGGSGSGGPSTHRSQATTCNHHRDTSQADSSRADSNQDGSSQAGTTTATAPPGEPDPADPAEPGLNPDRVPDPGPYRPPAALDRFIRTRDPRCTAPGCRAPAHRCDLDHILAYPTGPTCACNLHPLCRRHHRVKHEAGWHVHRDPHGTTTWTTHNHLTITVTAQPVLPTPRVNPPPGHQPGHRLYDADLTDHPDHPDHEAGKLRPLTAPENPDHDDTHGLRALRKKHATQNRPPPTTTDHDIGPPPF